MVVCSKEDMFVNEEKFITIMQTVFVLSHITFSVDIDIFSMSS